MAVCDSRKMDSNITGLAFAEEECLKKLPDLVANSGLGDAAVWYGREPNSYSDFGGEITTVSRSPIDPSRQNKKGTTTDIDASGGFNEDITKTNFTRLLQGFFFADARENASTQPLNGAALPITGVTSADKRYSAASGMTRFLPNEIVFASGFANASNNGLKVVATTAAGYAAVAETVVNETPSAAAKVEAVGFQFPAADVSVAVVDNIPSLLSTVTDFTTIPNLFPGAWVFIGGDAAANRFANNAGYARVSKVAANSLTFDDTTFIAVNEAGTGKTIRMFIATYIRNEKTPSLIKRRSYNIERQLGAGLNGTQAEYLEGAVANEFTLNIPQADKLNADVTFVACSNSYKSGDVGDTIKPGTRVKSLGEEALNTSSDVYRIKMSIIDPLSSNPAALFGYVTEANVTINNNVTPNKAVGVFGSFDTTAGNFEASGSITAYFTTVSAVRAVRNNADVGLSVILASKNAGFIYDMPLLGLGGGRLNVEKDAPVMVPLEPMGAENKNGYTMLYATFAYLPNLGMPQQ